MPFLVLYVPGVSLLRIRHTQINLDSETESKPHEICLCMPSQILEQTNVDERLCRLEWKLRYAQAHEALARVRQHLQVRAYLYKFKDRFVRGQGANTRANNTIESITAKVMAAAEEYRAAYAALLALSPRLSEASWQTELLPLQDTDIRDLSEGKAGESEGRRTISWIWKSVPAVEKSMEPGFLLERKSQSKFGQNTLSCSFNCYRLGVRVEWCQSRARAHRFTEEVELLTEEMARILRFFQWKANDWQVKGNIMASQQRPAPLLEAYTAYAERQAAIYVGLGKHFNTLWADLPAHVARMRLLISNPSSMEDFSKKKGRGRPRREC